MEHIRRIRLEVPDGDRPHWLVVPACAGELTVRAGERSRGPLPLGWTERRFGLPAGAREVELEVTPAPADPFAGFLAAIGRPPDGLWQGTRWEPGGVARFAARPTLRWADGRIELLGDVAWVVGTEDGTTHGRVEVLIDGVPASEGGEAGSWSVMAGEVPPVWRPDDPQLRRAEVELRVDGEPCARMTLPFVHRTLGVEGESVLWNGRVFRAQGLLHWGYYPELPGPDPEPEALRAELAEMKARGFNLLKACLWIPSHRFLDVCDEVGMAVWIEYPLWNHPLPGREVGDWMVAAYRDLILHDAAHPCVVLRTLTCENDHVDPETSHEIIDTIARVAPGGLAHANSSWIDHSPEPDFWDEHPYLHAAQWPFYLERTRRVIDRRRPKPLILGETMAFDSLDDEASREASVRLRRRQAEQLRESFPDAGYVICAARDIPQSPLGVQDAEGRWKTSVDAWRWQVEAALPPSVASAPTAGPALASPAERAIALPDGVTLAPVLHDEALGRCRAGAILFHPATPRSRAWRCPEHTFWSPVASWDAVACDETIPSRDLLFEDLLSGRGLVLPPPGLSRVLVAARDVHDQTGAESVQPFAFLAKVGRGILVVSSLRIDNEVGMTFHEALLARLADEGGEWLADASELVIEEPPASFFLDGPWTLRGEGVLGGEQIVTPGTMLVTGGRNAVQGWVEATATVTIPGDWCDPVLLRAEAIGDGFELWIDGDLVHTHGRPGFTWDAGRDRPATIDVSRHVEPGAAHEWRIRTKDHRGAGALVGPLYLCSDDPTRSVLY